MTAESLTLVIPGPRHRAQVDGLVAECRALGETDMGAGLNEYPGYDVWLERRLAEHHGTWLDPEWGVPVTTWLGLRASDGLLVGLVRVRWGDSPKIIDFDGHIGSGVRPTQRRKGYATALLEHALGQCRQAGWTRVLVTCDETNRASEALLRKAGGVFEDTRTEPDGNRIHRFWFPL